MSNPQKARGTRWESAVRDFLTSFGLPARREAQRGAKDVGDLSVGPPWSLECKDHAKIALAEFTDQATAQALAAGADYGVAIVKRRRASVAAAYAVTDLETMARIMADLQHAKDQVERLSILVEFQASGVDSSEGSV